jgi:hypothetical protein
MPLLPRGVKDDYNERMTRVRKLLALCGVILLAAACFCAYVTKRPADTVNKTIDVSSVLPYLKDGDIILRQGDGAWSPAFRDVSLTDKRFSHLGIARIREDTATVVNSVGYLRNKKKGVEEVSLEDFLLVAKSIGVFRAKGADGALVSDIALECVGRPFDWSFDLEDEGKIYCTELLYVALKYAAPSFAVSTLYIDKLGKEVIPLDAVSNSPDFEEIFYIE